ncbi:uncharacterized protein LOC144731390 [Lampetra planeri]
MSVEHGPQPAQPPVTCFHCERSGRVARNFPLPARYSHSRKPPPTSSSDSLLKLAGLRHSAKAAPGPPRAQPSHRTTLRCSAPSVRLGPPSLRLCLLVACLLVCPDQGDGALTRVTVSVFLFRFPRPVAVKPGSCPTPPPGAVGTCDEACVDDESCPGEQKCCSNGCGHGCVEPQVLGLSGVKLPVLTTIQVELGEASLSNGTLQGRVYPKVRPGCCRNPGPFLTKNCDCKNDLCHSDGECPGVRKCCPHPCGNRCEDVKSGKPKAGECLFVDTRLIRCAFQPGDCSEDCQCPGEQKCCNTGCTMACTKPAIVKPGSCPAMPVGFKPTCDIRCLNDDSCPDDQKCCSNGCGRLCLRPASGIVAVKPGSCPTPPPGTVGTCDEACTDDESCPGEQKCCSNGCGHSCVEPQVLWLSDVQLPVLKPIPVEPGRVKPEVRPGCCRDPDPFHIQFCIWKNDLCRGDGECPGAQKCCPHPCGNRCEDVKPVKAGSCPVWNFSRIVCIRYHEGCSSDDDCPNKQKCCSVPCGVSCLDPDLVLDQIGKEAESDAKQEE